jgi:superfamily II DNA or RNA helicase
MGQMELFGNSANGGSAIMPPNYQEMRPYQAEALAGIATSYRNGNKRPLLVMATGGGKTTVLAEFLRANIDPATQRVLVVAHTEEIIFQLRERIDNQFGGLGMINGVPGIGVVMASFDDTSARIVVATRQSLHPKRLEKVMEHGAFDYLIVDEAHHAIIANTYGVIMEVCTKRNPELRALGLTATPKRTDRQALGTLWDDIAFEWSIKDGVAEGYLSPPVRISVATEVNVSGVKTSRGDYSQRRLMSILKAYNWLELAMDAYDAHLRGKGRPTLAFMPSVDMSIEFVAALNATGVSARHIDGTTSKEDRRAILREYMAGTVDVVSNFGVLTEGFDAPHTQAIFMARPTRSAPLFTQIVGRGLRRYPGKTNCLIVDLTVIDTRALSKGTLLGDLVQCRECLSEYYKGYSHCPMCGAEAYKEEKAAPMEMGGPLGEPDLFDGEGIVARAGSLFSETFAAWYIEGGYSTCSMGDHGTLVIIPPVDDDYYRLIRIPKGRNQAPIVIGKDRDISALVFQADNIVQELARGLADRSGAWRSREVSPKQRPWLLKFGYSDDVIDTMTMGEASGIMTHRFTMDRVRGIKFDDKKSN